MAHAKTALRLALCVLLSVGVAAAAQTQDDKASAEAEKKEVKNFGLTTDKLDKYDAAVKAVHRVQKDNPTLKKQMDDDDSRNPSNTIAGSVATIEKYPQIAKAIKDAGLSPHDFVVMTYTLINSAAAVQMKKAGTIKEYPDSVLPENAAFVDKNYERIKKIFNSEDTSDKPPQK
jgi:N-acetylglucosamine-6-phosphate deacetylase